MDRLEKLTVPQLRDMLKDKGLSTRGNKRRLILRLQDELDSEDMDNIQPSDSVSNVGTQRAISNVSNVSAKSLLSVRRAEESAKRAALEKRREMLSKRYEMRLKELKLEMEKEEFELQAEIAEASARESVLQDIGSDAGRHSSISKRSTRERKPVISTRPQVSRDQGDRLEWTSEELSGSEVVKALVSYNLKGLMPKTEIPKFNGDFTSYPSFVRAFDSVIDKRLNNEEEKLLYLDQYTEGKPNDIIKACMNMETGGYKEARHLLDRRYGNPDRIISAYVEKILSWDSIKPENLTALDAFSIVLRNCCNALTGVRWGSGELNNPKTMRRIMEKLPFNMQDRWRRRAYDITENRKMVVCFEDLVAFIEEELEIVTNPLFGKQNSITLTDPQTKVKSPKDRLMCNVVSDIKPKQCWYCTGDHYMDICGRLQELEHSQILAAIKERGLCFACMGRGHSSKNCRRRLKCRICKGIHPTVLHRQGNVADLSAEPKAAADHDDAMGAVAEVINRVDNRESFVRMCIVPVMISSANGRSVCTYALLDNGSTASFCAESLVHKLGIDDIQETDLTLSTVLSSNSLKSKIVTGLVVSNVNGTNFINLPPVYTLKCVPASKGDITKKGDLGHWDHLKGIELPEQDEDVEMLIGINVPQAFEPWEIIHSPNGEGPFAMRTKLGWIVCGSLQSSKNVIVNRIEVRRIEQMLVDMYNKEFEDLHSFERGYSAEDKLWLQKVTSSCRMSPEGKYEVPLPFKNKMDLPNSRSQAMSRLSYLHKKFMKDVNLRVHYFDFMEEIFSKGYAEPVTELNKEVCWYLSHFAVYHPGKPNKVRVVFDCAARIEGVSLNDLLLQGPNLANGMLDVLFRFRVGKFAFSADIEGMFHQIRIPVEDRDFLRFLWWKNSDMEEVCEFRMCVHLFGACSSPSCANFALQKVALDYGSHYPEEVVHAMLENFYVDDCLYADDDEASLVDVAQDLVSLCMKGGFRLCKFSSSSRFLVDALPDEIVDDKSLKQLGEGNHIRKALGVSWNLISDVLSVSILVSDLPRTKKGLLSCIAKMYDPLGVVAPFILKGRLILQEMCRRKLGWSDPVPEDLNNHLHNWKEESHSCSGVNIQRDYGLGGSLEDIEMHCFSDASQTGYGVVLYFRVVDANGKAFLSFVYGKARVAPLKEVTIPRLELTAAALSVRVHDMFSFIGPIAHRTIFWTDSTTVLKYIRNETTRYQIFIANRISQIRHGSEVHQWRYVPSHLNPADDASRGKQSSRWICGPEFLLDSEDNWPLEPLMESVASEEDLEIRKNVWLTDDLEISPTEKLLTYFSSWYKIKISVAWFLRFKIYLLSRRSQYSTGVLTVTELRQAEKFILIFLQSFSFPSELRALRENRNIGRGSPLFKLNPILNDGLLRVGGRLRSSSISFEARHPIILPKNHSVCKGIVRDYHKQSGHMGKNQVVAHLRQRFWILQVGVLVKRILKDCVKCKKIQGKVMDQLMADLPSDRVTAGEPPFSSTGVDLFGPFYVTRGRTQVKRYGVVFTCMAIRAIHLEVAVDLSTGSFINVLRRFIARRGQIKILRCDRGTNFVGAQTELKKAMTEWNESAIHKELLIKGIEWVFNPPHSSHFGGVWERHIRTIRKVLAGIMEEQALTDDALHTLFCEVEAIINSRPLTHVSHDCEDPLPLTPGNLLSLGSCSASIGEFNSGDSYSRKKWKQVQYLADLFWSRWRKEYLVELQKRHKWNNRKRNLKVNDIVLIVDNSLPRCHWLMGRVLNVHHGSDGMVRKATVRCKTGTLLRPLSKLIILVESEDLI